ncbi:MAG TPA: DUF1232 domain-containing protein [Thermoanaerobaculia bacterium]|nr:DUF1232 domain-containing protein [Thermoanaerobaculia bacterium]
MPDESERGVDGFPRHPEEDARRSAVAADFAELDDDEVRADDAYDSESEEALAGGLDEVSDAKLLSFYDRLRERILHTIERRGGKLGEGAVKALLVVPDVFILLTRLTLDKNVPGPTRALIGGALAYFVLPTDLLPEMILGGAGYMEDLVLASAVLSQAFGGELEPYARRHWSGPEDLRVVLRDISQTAQSLLGTNLYDRLRRLLGRRGIDVDGPRR